MSLNKTTRLGLAILLILLGLTACGPTATAAPTVTPTASQEPTETLEPTMTDEPTLAPPTQAGGATENATPGATTAAGTPAATQAAAVGGATPAPAKGSGAADKYQYLGQSLPDKSQLLPGRTVTITWTVKNAGTNGWTKDYVLRYFSGPKPGKDIYTFGKDVPAGQTINFNVTFTTPTELGDYDLWFKLTNTQSQNFGDLDFAFTVTNNPTKATAKPAATTAP